MKAARWLLGIGTVELRLPRFVYVVVGAAIAIRILEDLVDVVRWLT